MKDLSLVVQEVPNVRLGFVVGQRDSITRRVVNSEGTLSRYTWNPITVSSVVYARSNYSVYLWDSDYVSAENLILYRRNKSWKPT